MTTGVFLFSFFLPFAQAPVETGESEASAASEGGDDYVHETFAATRVMYNHSTEMLPKKTFEFIVAHKFGDILTRNSSGNITGNFDEWFGFDNLADVRFGFEFGVLNNLTVGVGRSKGYGVTRQVADGYFKYRILQQKNSGMPISMAFVGSMGMPYAKSSADSTSVASYPKWTNRFIYTSQLLISRKFGEIFSLQLNLGYNHRNFVAFNDVNDLFFTGIAGRLRFTKFMGVVVEYSHIWNTPTVADAPLSLDPLTVGFEIVTGGHSFVFGYSNARGMNENVFIPYTSSNWLDGQFRIGFAFTRRFKL